MRLDGLTFWSRITGVVIRDGGVETPALLRPFSGVRGPIHVASRTGHIPAS